MSGASSNIIRRIFLYGFYLIIYLFARIFDVSFSTVRVLVLPRGNVCSPRCWVFFEVSIYITALSQVVQELNSLIKVLIYALGFSSGTLVGGFIEEKIALGYAMVQLIPKKHASQLIMALRAENFKVTIVEGKAEPAPVRS